MALQSGETIGESKKLKAKLIENVHKKFRAMKDQKAWEKGVAPPRLTGIFSYLGGNACFGSRSEGTIKD